jgi:hypothetical protein
MANKIRGEVSFESPTGESFTLKYDVNALCELEDMLDMGIPEFASVFKESGKIRLKHVRAAFWAGLRHHRPEVSLSHAGNLMMAIGGMAAALDLIGEAFSRTFPESDGKEDGGERPQKGQGSKTRGAVGAQSALPRSNSGDALLEKQP